MDHVNISILVMTLSVISYNMKGFRISADCLKDAIQQEKPEIMSSGDLAYEKRLWLFW